MTGALIVVAACTLALLVVVVAGRVRNRDRRAVVLEELDARLAGAGSVLSGATPDGAPLDVALADSADRTLLAFLSSSCVTCRGLWAEIGTGLSEALGRGTRVVVVTEDPADERPDAVRALAPPALPVLMSSATWRRYGVTVAPFFVLVEGSSGRVLAAGAAADGAAVRRLARPATRG